MSVTASSAKIALLRPLRLGFVALTDSAPLIVAQELGLFTRHGLRVQLTREIGWATVRDKVAFGELDAAPAPAPILWSTQLGLGCAPADVCTAFVVNLHGNAITLSHRLRAAGVVDAETLRAEALRRRGENRLTFGVVFPFSTHHVMLLNWLRAARLDPARDVRIAIVPPAQMFRNLVAGTLDGYCAGEPWNTLAVQQGEGWCPAFSATAHPGHVEKVLMVRREFAEDCPSEHFALLRALWQAAAWCDQPENRGPLATLLSHRAYLNLPAKVIAPALLGRFADGVSVKQSLEVPDFHIFHRGGANVPTVARAEAIQTDLISAGLVQRAAFTVHLPSTLFREDLFREATANLDLHESLATKLPASKSVSA